MTDDPSGDGVVHRRQPLPRAPGRGRLLVSEPVAEETLAALRSFSGDDGPHEGIALWAGQRTEEDVVVCSVVVPEAEHTWGSVRIGHAAVGSAARAARRAGMVLVAQVHSHPGVDTRHSDGDDEMVLLPHEGMYSVVVGNYGEGSILPAAGAGLHQFQDGVWVAVEDGDHVMTLVPTVFAL
jgi:proteasome lid subunit RPN8/RPN11